MQTELALRRHVSGGRVACVWVVALTLLAGCATVPRDAVLMEVPFLPQEQPNHCGIIALAMVFDYFHVSYDMSNLVGQAFVPVLNGSTPELLGLAAESHGLAASCTTFSIEDLRTALADGQVPLIYLAPNDGDGEVGHFAVVTGVSLNGKQLRVHEPDRAHHWVRSNLVLRRGEDGRLPGLLLKH